MQVRETTLKELIQGEKQFRVPLWQRQYTWKSGEHQLLWSDILEQYAQLAADSSMTASSGHFLGSFVLSPAAFAASDVATFLIVDGQQRMTTLLLMLCAVRDAQAVEQPAAAERINDLYLINKYKQGLSKLRLLPTQEDRDAFEKCVKADPAAGGKDGIGAAYQFFRSRLELPDNDGIALDLALLERVIVERLAIVDITTGAGDNAHRIFQSLNGTGVELTQADLLRNYIFMLLPSQAEEIYAEVWRPMEQLVGFQNLEGLARVDLQRRGVEVAKDDIYRLHQERLDKLAGHEDAVADEVRDLKKRAEHYKRLVDPASEPDPELRGRLQRLASWGAQTTYPVLMYGYDLLDQDKTTIDELRQAAAYIEGFVIRRHIAGVPTNSLSKLFVAMITQLPIDVGFADGVRQVLSGGRRNWPTDEQIRQAVRSRPFYLIGRSNQRMLILERLEQSFESPEPVDLAIAQLTIEHIMPQTLSTAWREQLQALGQDPDEVRDELLHTLGNLTLTGVNTQLSNNPFDRAWVAERLRAQQKQLAGLTERDGPRSISAEQRVPRWTRATAYLSRRWLSSGVVDRWVPGVALSVRAAECGGTRGRRSSVGWSVSWCGGVGRRALCRAGGSCRP